MATSFDDLRERGFPALTWSQGRPAGPILAAVEELTALVRAYERYAEAGMLFICHSRGGLIARKYLESGDDRVRGVITLGSPHRGTTLARWAGYVYPAALLLNRIIESYRRREVLSAVQRICQFLTSTGLKELLPGSSFFADLKEERQRNTFYLSFGGTNPDIFRIKSLSLHELAARVIPGRLIPDEVRVGYGDGLVSAASSVLSYADEHRDFHVHHVQILLDREVREHLVRRVEALL
ncbi:MAG: hypothetical protein K8I29_11550 [Alphaproteobacteria bacterium]|uniref:Serine aminopeptidase S33 domain-containing protein n=1 Tax=Candidatus Nitrobium versatile TaxID=2884831 RepID=A0A953M256_9BACT|nr:hypothetical protein [Candidatus Nitrobium versatile]